MSLDELLREAIREAIRHELRAALEEFREELAQDRGVWDGEQARELMNAEEAADFIRMPYQQFRHIAPLLPRHPISQRRYVYRRSELLEWVVSGRGKG
jgi:hypothetical protein